MDSRCYSNTWCARDGDGYGNAGTSSGKEDAEAPHDANQEEGSTVATINGEVITDKDWTDALKRRYGSEILLQMLNRKAVYAEALQRNLVVTPTEIAREMAEAMDGYDSENFIMMP